MKAKRIFFAVLCVLLVLVIIMTGIVILRVNRLYQWSHPSETTPSDSSSVPPPSSGGSTESTLPSENATVPSESEHEHDFVLTSTIAASCEGYGWNVYTCTVCGHVDMPLAERVNPLGHDYGHGEVIAPTCTEGGYTEFVCSRCIKVIVKDETDPLGHEFDAGTEVPATCTEDAATVYRCVHEGCTESKSDPIPGTATGHTFGAWTYLETGEAVQICEGCGEIRYDTGEDPDVYTITGISKEEQSNPAGVRCMVYSITVGVVDNPDAGVITYTIYDYLNNDTLSFYYDVQKGLVIRFIDPDGMEQLYALAEGSLTINSDGSTAGG